MLCWQVYEASIREAGVFFVASGIQNTLKAQKHDASAASFINMSRVHCGLVQISFSSRHKQLNKHLSLPREFFPP